ncbi:MAG: VCBS repeat-containing protein [Bacteroidota bacterium]
MKLSKYIVAIVIGLWVTTCGSPSPSSTSLGDEFTPPKDAKFQEVTAEESGFDFANNLALEADFDVFRYRNYYNGGGVAIGDVDNDGKPDVYMTANTESNKLFLNKGEFKFEDITESSGAGGTHAWSTGVAMADVNGDNWLDIYVCNSGDLKGNRRENELFINQQDGTFKEAAEDYGLADSGFSTHAVFFDYDKDGDLDCYVLNNSFQPVAQLQLRNLRNIRDEYGGDKLYRNDNGKFIDVSEEKNILGSVIAFGLGVTVGDINGDGWEDIYVSNDFYERDYLYINQRDGNFVESLPDYLSHTSHFSMGADIGDLNNDGAPEIFVTDMLADNLERVKQTTNFLSYDEYVLRIRKGFHYQSMRNSLQLNDGRGNFQEIGQLTGVEATDWSWGALLADLDNNGYRDLFVCNGIYKDVTDQDFVNFLANEENMASAERGEEIDFEGFVERMPSRKISNYAFANFGDLEFENVTENWGLARPTHSNGAAYGDLDGDGDLDLIVNNVNAPALLYRNQTREQDGGRALSFNLTLNGKNTRAVGSRITIYKGEEKIVYDHMPMKGFQSSMDYCAVIGIGKGVVDSVMVRSPYGEFIRIDGETAMENNLHEINFSISSFSGDQSLNNQSIQYPNNLDQTAKFFGDEPPLYRENFFIDFDYEPLVYHMRSAEGPRMAQSSTGDLYLPGAAGQSGSWWQLKDGRYRQVACNALRADADFEDTDALWFDADGDGDEDLYVVSGGTEYLDRPPLLADRIYLREGNDLVRGRRNLPRSQWAGSSICSLDIEGDGDLDLVIGSHLNNDGFGLPVPTRLLENNGKGQFRDATQTLAPELASIGLVTRVVSADFDGNGKPDLALAGEFMPITLLFNEGGRLSRVEALPNSRGMYRGLAVDDLDGDGRADLVVGNLGLNSRFRASEEQPMHLYVNDFDQNGTVEQIYALTEDDGEVYPMALRHILGAVMPSVKQRFPTYADYQVASAREVIPALDSEKTEKRSFTGFELLEENTVNYTADNFATGIWFNRSDGWSWRQLPWQAQLSPNYAVLIEDLNGDGAKDIILGGNFYGTQPEIGPYDASRGAVLINGGSGNFTLAKQQLPLNGQVRDFELVESNGKNYLIVGRNSAAIQVLEISGYEIVQ